MQQNDGLQNEPQNRINRDSISKMACNINNLVSVLDTIFKDLQIVKDKDIVVCIGDTGCGKSTLLNLLFGTKFDVMDDQNNRQQTTKGIWMSSTDDKKVLIFDIEGTDSQERGEQRLTFE